MKLHASFAAASGDAPSPSSTHYEDPKNRLPVSEDDVLIDPIAIVGFSFRFPQSCSTESFWEMLMEQRCTAVEFPKNRLSASALYHPDADRRGTIPFRGGNFIDGDIAAFDAPFFSISDSEAASMDPQQRGLLETTYRALENAGLPSDKIFGSKTSVFTGCFTNDWQQLSLKDSENCSSFVGLGIEASMNANRISWFFDFRGTSSNVDSACSSSLVALDLACQSLISKDTNMSIAAGCNMVIYPDLMLALSNMGLLSPDNRCFAFDDRANGYARGEGFGALVLKRLSDAVRDNDVIRAVIRSTGCNQDGRTPGITQPSSEAQAALIRATYKKAGLSMSKTRFVEAHGTGTAIGDPIEISALGDAFRHERHQDDPLYVGAVKTNIGHLEGASGIAGVIKTILVLEKGMIPPNTNFDRVNPKIDTDFLRIKFPLKPTPWPSKGLRRASVNSFGFGGTNAHAVLDDAYHYLRDHGLNGNHYTVEDPPLTAFTHSSAHLATRSQSEHGSNLQAFSPKLLVLSANDRDGLERLTSQYRQAFATSAQTSFPINSYLESLAYTLNCRRTLLPWKSYFLAESMNDLLHLSSRLSPGRRSVSKPKVGFIFTGQGAQWAGMGRELMGFHVFEKRLKEAESYIHQLGCQWDLCKELLKEEDQSEINKPRFSQPILTAVQVALVDLLRDFGVQPTVVVGHSSGEIAAAYCAGAISAQAAWKVAYYRGFFTALLAESDEQNGAMMSVGLSEAEAHTCLEQLPNESGVRDIWVACINSHKSVTFSGDLDQINALECKLKGQGIFARKLIVDVAYHSPKMQAIAHDYGISIQQLEKGVVARERVIMVSSVTGQRVTADKLCSSQYWVDNMLSPVKFSAAMGKICTRDAGQIRKKLDCSHHDRLQVQFLLEIGPHSALRGPVRDIVTEASGGSSIEYASALIRRHPSLHSLLESLGQLHCLGYSMDLNKVNQLNNESGTRPRLLHDLPEYPFDHSNSYWEESRISKRLRLHPQTALDLLGKPVPDWNPLEARWRKFIRKSELPWVEDHIINEAVIYPAAGMLVMAIEAANQTADTSRVATGFTLKDVLFQKALNIPQDSEGIETNFYLRQIHDVSDASISGSEFRLCSFENDEWQENCRGSIRVEYQRSPTAEGVGRESVKELDQCRRIDERLARSCTEAFDHSELYKTLKDCGYNFGHSFQRLRNGFSSTANEARSNVMLYDWPSSQYPQSHIVHPTSLDAILHSTLAAVSHGGRESIATAIPTLLRKMWISKSGLSHAKEHSSVRTAAWMTAANLRGSEFDISVLNETGDQVLARIECLKSTMISDIFSSSPKPLSEKQVCYHLAFKPDVEILDNRQLSAYCAQVRYLQPGSVQFFEDLSFVLLAFLSRSVESIDPAMTNTLQPHLRKYIDWAKLQVRKYHDGKLPYSKPGWEMLLHDDCFIESLYDDVKNANDLGRIFVTTGRSLSGILRGEIDPLEFLFKTDLLKDLYREVNGSRTCFTEFAWYLDALCHKKPTMKILEVGAGTGGTTERILSALSSQDGAEPKKSRYSSYHYTDISPAFFEKAQVSFRSYPNMIFNTLDIEFDPSLQGYETETYDLIIAANVLHATRDINVTMQHVRKLLKPGGKLMMYEPTQLNVLRTGFIAGLMSGWWLATEDFRQWGASLSSKLWEKVLLDNGFSGLDLELPDFVNPECHEGSILVSRATSITSDKNGTESVVFIANPKSALQVTIAQRLKATLSSGKQYDCRVLSLDEAAAVIKSNNNLVFFEELERPLIWDLSPNAYSVLQELLTSSKSVLWITAGGGSTSKDPRYAIVNGLSRVLRNENPERPLVTLALDVQGGITEKHFQHMHNAFQTTQSAFQSMSYEPEFVEIDGFLNIPRVIADNKLSQELFQRSLLRRSVIQSVAKSPPLRLAVESPGLIDTLHFVEDDGYRCKMGPDEVEIEVRAVGMNFKDCLVALGRIPYSSFGSECAGLVTRVGENCDLLLGDRVVMTGAETCKTFVSGPAQQAFKISDAMTLVEAASIPSQFATAWQAVHGLARIRKGESILIHAGAGGTGQAAIQVSQHFGAEIFATVGSEAKKHVLRKEYGIPDDHIFYSRDTSFAKGVMRMTGGKGVDVIINSLAGDSLIASWECIASYGRFIEIGKKDVLSNSKLPMYPFRNNASYICFDGFAWQIERPLQARECLQDLFNSFAAGNLHVVRPLHTYDISEVIPAFRAMQDGKSAGKIVLEVNPGSKVPTSLLNKPSFGIDPDSTYLIAGGLGGLGRSIARWLVDRGAKNLLLLSRSGAKSEVSLAFLEELRRYGTRVEAPPCDVTDAISLGRMLDQCAANMPPIKGCIQGSMVLKDALFENMTHADWRAGTDCKTAGSWNLHTLLPRDLDFFIMLSSASGIVGLRGQANYAAGNTYMDALGRHRVANGERAVTLDLGAMIDDGLLSENTDLLNRVLAYGALQPISRAQFSTTLDYYCDPKLPRLTPTESQSIIGLGAGAGPGLDGIAMSRQAIFAHLHCDSDDPVFSEDADGEKTNFKRLFSAAGCVADAATVVSRGLIEKLGKTLPAMHDEVDVHKPLAACGVDSLLAVELRGWMAKEFQADIAVFEISGGSTLSSVSLLVAARSKLKRAA